MPTADSQILPSTPQEERRSRHPSNVTRRFFNDFWLIPLVVIYLQLLAALMASGADTRSDLWHKNKRFFSGIPVLMEIISHDFPHALSGHAKQIIHTFGIGSAPLRHDEVVAWVTREKDNIYAALLNSQSIQETEVGGVVSQSATRNAHLIPIPSSNGAFLTTLSHMPKQDAVDALLKPDNQDMIAALAGHLGTLQRVARIIKDPAFSADVQQKTFDSMIYSLTVASEARYLVRPLPFKSALGHMNTWQYAGMFHFHNELNIPPSEADIIASFDVRQFVFCLARDGFDLYNVENGHTTSIHFQVL